MPDYPRARPHRLRGRADVPASVLALLDDLRNAGYAATAPSSSATCWRLGGEQ
jgi:cobalamin biosynthesis Mg chelatase CobN